MEIDLRESLTRTFLEICEEVAFMFADPIEEGSDMNPMMSLKWFRGEIIFQGPYSGKIVLAMPEPLCKDLSMNMLGWTDDEKRDPDYGKDALGELLNILCGKFLINAFGKKPIFEFSIPEVTSFSQESLLELYRDSQTIILQIEGQPLLIKGHLEGETR